MDKELIGTVSCAVVLLSALPYAWRTYQKKIQPQVTSWSLWTIISLALALTYKDSGAGANMWPVVFGFVNSAIITTLAFRAKNCEDRIRLTSLDKICTTVIFMVLLAWAALRDQPELVQFVLYGAIFANAVAAIPTVAKIKKDPGSERPAAWALLGIGYGLAFFAVEKPSIANYALPLYTIILATWVTSTLTLHRVKNRIRIREWV